MAEFGLNIATASRAERDLNDIKAFVEMHIEQGPLLESAGCSVGIVDAIKGNYRFSVTVKGKTDHAGFPMAGRQDALVGAVRLINLQLDAAARYRAEGTLLTVGQIETSPGLENVVPGKARFSIDYRSPDLTVLKELEKILLDQMKTLSEDLNLEMSHETLLVIDPLPLSSDIRTLLIKSAEELKLPYRILQSGAGHDAQVLGPGFQPPCSLSPVSKAAVIALKKIRAGKILRPEPMFFLRLLSKFQTPTEQSRNNNLRNGEGA